MAEKIRVHTTINDTATDFLCESRQSLLEVIRDVLGLTGTKEGCNDGNCGACTVIMDGRIVNSCCVLGVEAEGKSILTIEGVASPAGLHPLQQAFLEEAALQCGICTPGFILAAKALLDREPNADEARIRRWLAGNLCRCTGYDKIVRAVLKAEEKMKQSRGDRREAAVAVAGGPRGAVLEEHDVHNDWASRTASYPMPLTARPVISET